MRIDISDDYIFLSDRIYMFQVPKNGNYSDQIMWLSEYNILDIKVYEDTGKIHLGLFNILF